MKNLVLALSLMFLASCGESSENSIDPNGPDVEVNVLEFDQANRKTKIEILNRLESPIKSINGRLIFLDESGNALTTATGMEKTSPFSYSKNPNIVGSMQRVEHKLSNSIPEGTSSITIEDISGKTTDGEF
jgi:hypothetical protein